MQRAEARARLGVGPDADAAAVEAAFRLLARSAHPDRGGDVDRFQQLVEARRVLVERTGRPKVVVFDDRPALVRMLRRLRRRRRHRRPGSMR